MAALPHRDGSDQELTLEITLLDTPVGSLLLGDLEVVSEKYFVGVSVFGMMRFDERPTTSEGWERRLEEAAGRHKHALYDFAAAAARVQLGFINGLSLVIPVKTPEPTTIFRRSPE